MAEKQAWLWIVLAVIVVVLISSGKLNFGGTSTTDNGGTTIVTTSTVLSPSASNAAAGGTSVSPTYQYSVGGSAFSALTSGTTTANQGDLIDVIANASGYHSGVIQAHTVPKVTNDNTMKFAMDANASVTEVMYYPYSGVNINSGGGANNITNGAVNGASYTLQDTMYGTSLQSTSDMTCVIELTSGINATTSPAGVQYSGGGATTTGTSAPAWYSVVGANSKVWTFDQPAIKSAAGVTNTLVISALSTKSFPVNSYVKKACYSKEWFVDPNTGKLTFAVADSNNLVKSLNTYTFTGYFL